MDAIQMTGWVNKWTSPHVEIKAFKNGTAFVFIITHSIQTSNSRTSPLEGNTTESQFPQAVYTWPGCFQQPKMS